MVGKGSMREGGEGQTQHKKSGGCVGDDAGGNSRSLPLFFLVFLGMEKCVCVLSLSHCVLGGGSLQSGAKRRLR